MTATIYAFPLHLLERGNGTLAEWRSALDNLAIALADFNQHKDLLISATEELELIEAQITVSIEGRNEGERRAKTVLALNESPDYRRALARKRAEQCAVRDSERTIELAKHKCRWASAAMAFLTGTAAES